MSSVFESVYSRLFDVVVFGAGYAGVAAATALREQGRSVLLVDRQPAALWESGWAFSQSVGQSSSRAWAAFNQQLQSRHAGSNTFIDGAIAEVMASKLLTEKQITVLYYATPIGVLADEKGLSAVAVAVKEGVRFVRGQQFIDATETGELLHLLSPSYTPAKPVRQQIHLYFRQTQWPDAPATTLPAAGDLPGATLTWSPSLWPNERVLSIDLPGDYARQRAAWIPALTALHNACGDALQNAVLSHGSVAAFPSYARSTAPVSLPANVAAAVPGLAEAPVSTLAERFDLGLAAAAKLASAPVAPFSNVPHDFVETSIRSKPLTADVVVAGAGTGGAFAAIAAARQGANTISIEPLPFAGGIGAGGGIHWYYYGVRGGLQEEIDDNTRRIMGLFGKTSQLQGFHPDAKKCVIEQALVDAGVTLLTGSTLYGVDVSRATISRAHVATPAGAVALSAAAWIDSTGDGDLAAHAGAHYILGREADGQLHAFSQSSGRIHLRDGNPRMGVVNFDAGYVDPTDTEDLTRARQLGVSHYEQQQYTPLDRPTYIAPALGLRQGRHIETDYVLTLQDLITRRTFPDAVGQTGAHYDNHAIDYEFESDEAMFWVWVCRQWRTHVACEIPYRMILPVGLDNAWIACRAAGVSIEAHHSMRMQRDIQRLGEIAGLAAALAVKEKSTSRSVSYPRLRALLEATGALKADQTDEEQFGPKTTAKEFADEKKPADLEQWLADLKTVSNASLYHLMQHRRSAEPHVLPLLGESDAAVSFRAAAIVAMWNLPAAEPRLLAAIRSRESGYESAGDSDKPEQNNRHVPHWIVAITLLRRCGTPAVLNDLFTLAGDPQLLHSARTAVALTVSAIASREKLSPEQKNVVSETLKRLLSSPSPNAIGDPQRRPSVAQPLPAAKPTAIQPAIEDQTWQLHLAIAHAENAAKLPIHPAATKFLKDPRATVRKAFTKVLQNY